MVRTMSKKKKRSISKKRRQRLAKSSAPRRPRPTCTAGAVDNGDSWMAAISCGVDGEEPRWVLVHPEMLCSARDEAERAGDTELAAAYHDQREIFGAPDSFRAYLEEHGWQQLEGYVQAPSWDTSRSEILGDADEPEFGEATGAAEPDLQAMLMTMVGEQLAADDPPEVSQALQRLHDAGHDPEEARELVGFALADALVIEEPDGSVRVDREAYVHSLERFPDLSALAEAFDLDDPSPW